MQRISILIANRNTLPFLRLCLKSLKNNLSRKDHQILILDDASTDGSDDWLKTNQSGFGYDLELHTGSQRLGIVDAYNRLVEAAENPIVFLVHTDMYFGPKADEEIRKYLSPTTVCTCTRIEPPLYPQAPHKIIADLGIEAHEFREEEFLKLTERVSKPGYFTEGIFAPIMCFKEDFLAIGGLDPVFGPQSREDSDLFNRMAIAGYRFRQSWSAFCYHFSGRGSRKKDGYNQDSEEWKISNRKNERNFIRRWRHSVKHDKYLKPIVPTTEPISLVSLMGNEPGNVIPFLENLEPYFDEIIFVADGPQHECEEAIDQYIKQEQEMGPNFLKRDKIKVFERPLVKDFGSQRNFGQKHCQNNWVLQADLDERFDRGLLESLQEIILEMLRQDKTVCGFPRFNYLDGVLVNDLPREQWTPQGLENARSKPIGSIFNLDPQFRFLYRKVQWQGRVHETPEPLIKNHDQVMFWRHAGIHHHKTLRRQYQQNEYYETIASGASLRTFSDISKKPEYRVLMLASEYPPIKGYGLARYTFDLAAALVKIGVEVDVICMNSYNGIAGYTTNGVHVHLIDDPLGFHSFETISDTVLQNIPLLERAVNLIRQKHFDLIATHDWTCALTANALKNIYRIPHVLTIRKTEIGKKLNRLTREQIYVAELGGWIIQAADRIIAASEFICNEMSTIYKIPKNIINVVPGGVNPVNFVTDCNLQDFRRFFAPDDAKIILFVGRLSPEKGPQVLLEAASTVITEFPKSTFIFAGEGELSRELYQKAPQFGPETRILFTGHLQGKVLAAIYRIADCLVVPSLYGASGLVAMEGMVCGLPVVVSGTGSLNEIVEHERTGLKVPPGNTDKLAQAIIRMFESPELACSLSQAAAENSWQEWSWEKAAHRIKTIYQEVVKNTVRR